MAKIVILGAGDGGRLLSQLLKEQKDTEIIGFIDDNKGIQGKDINGYKVVGTSGDLKRFRKTGFVVAVGMNMKTRHALFEKAVAAGCEPVSVIHKTAVIDKSVQIGSGSIILPCCVVNPFVTMGKNIFLFTGTIIEHDSIVGDNVYFSPNVSLAGHVKVGNNTFFGINACAIEGIKIGSNVIVGAGSVVLKDVSDNKVVAGVPAKILRKND